MWSFKSSLIRNFGINKMRFYSSPSYAPSLLSLKVAQIVQVENHANASKLYVSQVQHSTDPEVPLIQVCSGLVPFLDKTQLLNSKIVIVANLKPSKMRGEKSELMLLAASQIDESNSETVELVRPPQSSQIGDVLKFQKYTEGEPASRLKSKQWSEIAEHLRTNDKCQVVYKDSLLVNEKGEPCSVESLKNADVR